MENLIANHEKVNRATNVGRSICASGISAEDRANFLKYVGIAAPNDCWLWRGRVRRGYGQLTVKGRNFAAHRYAYAVFRGFVPGGILVCHTCDQRSCCNPRHLWLGTTQENTKDRQKKERQAKGARHGRAKLSETDVINIKRLYRGGKTGVDIAKQYGLSQCTVSQIVTGKRWSHLP